MNDNDWRNARIEEAAKAIKEADSGFSGLDADNPAYNYPDEDARWLRSLAEAALDVFEKAHTPTDDEREAMRRIIAQGSYSLTPESLPYEDVAYRLVEAGFGFRRSAEPQGEPSDAQVAEIEQRAYDQNRGQIAGMAKALVRAGWDAALRAAGGVR